MARWIHKIWANRYPLHENMFSIGCKTFRHLGQKLERPNFADPTTTASNSFSSSDGRKQATLNVRRPELVSHDHALTQDNGTATVMAQRIHELSEITSEALKAVNTVPTHAMQTKVCPKYCLQSDIFVPFVSSLFLECPKNFSLPVPILYMHD